MSPSEFREGDKLVSEYTTQDEPHRLSPEIEKLEQLKRHIVQIEAITLATIFFVSIGHFQPVVAELLGDNAAFLLPFPFLAAIGWLAPVVNPEDDIRARIKWGLTGLGTGATVGGGIAGALSGGLGAPAGALIGGAIGFVMGVASGPKLDGSKAVYTQGQAREHLMGKRKRYPDLDFQLIIDATEYPPKVEHPVRMFVSDGAIKCAKEDLDEWVRNKSWR